MVHIVQIFIILMILSPDTSSAITLSATYFPIVIDDRIYQWDEETLTLQPLGIQISPFPAYALISPNGRFIAYRYELPIDSSDLNHIQNLSVSDIYMIDLQSNHRHLIASQSHHLSDEDAVLRGNLTWSSRGETLLWQEYVITSQHVQQQVVAYDVATHVTELIPIVFIGGDAGLQRAANMKAIADYLVLFDPGGIYGQSLTIYAMDGSEVFRNRITPPALFDIYNRFHLVVSLVHQEHEYLALYFPYYNQWDTFDIREGIFTPLPPDTVVTARNPHASPDGLTLLLDPIGDANEIMAVTADGQVISTGIPTEIPLVITPSGTGILYIQNGLHYWQDGEVAHVRDVDTVFATLPLNMMQRNVVHNMQPDLTSEKRSDMLIEHECSFDPLIEFQSFPKKRYLDSPADVYLYSHPIRQLGGRLESGAEITIYDAICSMDMLSQTPSCFWYAGFDTARAWIETDCGIASG